MLLRIDMDYDLRDEKWAWASCFYAYLSNTTMYNQIPMLCKDKGFF